MFKNAFMTQFTNLRRANSAPTESSIPDTESSIPDAKSTVCRANSALLDNQPPPKKQRTSKETPDVLARTVAAVEDSPVAPTMAPTMDPYDSDMSDESESESEVVLARPDSLWRNGKPYEPPVEPPLPLPLPRYEPPIGARGPPKYVAPKRGRTRGDDSDEERLQRF